MIGRVISEAVVFLATIIGVVMIGGLFVISWMLILGQLTFSAFSAGSFHPHIPHSTAAAALYWAGPVMTIAAIWWLVKRARRR